MRVLSASLCMVSLVGLTGCAASPPLVLHDPIGPQRPHLTRRRMDGDLVVFCAARVSWYAQAEYTAYTDYTIYTDDGKMLREVSNGGGSFNGYPARVALQPGTYRVKALAEGGGYVIVPVIIEAGETTVVNLADPISRPRAADR